MISMWDSTLVAFQSFSKSPVYMCACVCARALLCVCVCPMKSRFYVVRFCMIKLPQYACI